MPDASVVVTALAAPLNVTVAPLPIAAGEIVPLIVTACAVKLAPVTLLPAIVTGWLAGLNVHPFLAASTV